MTISPIIRSTYAVYGQSWNKSNKMQQLRFSFAMSLLYMFRLTFSPIIRSTYAVHGQWWNKYKMQQLRFLFALAILYMFRATISPIFRSIYAVYGQCWNKSNKMQQLRFFSQWLYSTYFGWQSHPSSGVYMLYMAKGEISTTRWTIGFFIHIGFNQHVSDDNLAHHQEYICCIWPMVK